MQSTTARVDARDLRDVSAPQPRLPIPEAQWDPMTFAKRCALTRVGGDGKSHLKMFYLALALLGQPLVRSDVTSFRIRLENLLFILEISERTYYTLRRRLIALGLADIKRTAKSTYVRVFARRMQASRPPFVADAEWQQISLPDSATFAESDSAKVAESIDVDQRRTDPDLVSLSTSRSLRGGGGGTEDRPAPPPVACSRGKTRSQISFAQDLGLNPDAYPNGVELGEAIEKANAERCSSRTGGSFMDIVDDWPPKSCTACGADLRGETFDPEKGCPRPECGSLNFADAPETGGAQENR